MLEMVALCSGGRKKCEQGEKNEDAIEEESKNENEL
jgi:hypothetical protein